MFLQEAIIEKEFIETMIGTVVEVIMRHNDDDNVILEDELDMLDKLYDKYQLFCIAIDRAIYSTNLDYEGKKMSISDGIALKKIIDMKIKTRKKLLEWSNDIAFKKELDILYTDYKILDMAIQRTLWLAEV